MYANGKADAFVASWSDQAVYRFVSLFFWKPPTFLWAFNAGFSSFIILLLFNKHIGFSTASTCARALDIQP